MQETPRVSGGAVRRNRGISWWLTCSQRNELISNRVHCWQILLERVHGWRCGWFIRLSSRHQFAVRGELDYDALELMVGACVTLRTHYILDAGVASARQGVGREHHFGLPTEEIQRFVDLFRRLQCIPHRRSAQSVDVMNSAGDVLRRPERLELREVRVHLRRSFGAY